MSAAAIERARGWLALLAVILEPAPWVLAWIAVGLLAVAARRARFAESTPQLGGV
ncbi:hypothetical protein [Nocardia bhagyanarayanae]|uniref:Uncharacterized protein n=1 Tax=Nocardia bhagyanarayanae TaxID=1215925 RepID=A0A543FFZ8_9NOCA|nr:hypothetical protein [Nocardia bhagyanarayanae]TQM32787.1 hypothetical protein FB390_4484 [Nocardia bhagyanarayanae]